MIKDYKKKQLHENWQLSGSEKTFAEWLTSEQENDPDFFRWLFDDYNLLDFECSQEQRSEFVEYLNSIKAWHEIGDAYVEALEELRETTTEW